MYPKDLPRLIDFIEKEAIDNPQTCPAICTDSRLVRPGDIFIALPGTIGTRDGAEFIADAIAKGSTHILCTPRALAYLETLETVAYVPVKNLRETLGFLARARYNTRVLQFPVIGITGTNGKTTIAAMLHHVYTHIGKTTGTIGTIGYTWPGHHEEAKLTTPDCLSIHRMLGAMKQAQVGAVFIETSSHALDQGRLEGVDFMGAIFTNLTQDHLDYHKDMQHYFDAKARLFTELAYKVKPVAINFDDPWGKELYAQVMPINKRTLAFGFGDLSVLRGMNMQGEILAQSAQGLHLRMTYMGKVWEIHSPLIGRFNAENLLATQAICAGLGLPISSFSSLENFTGVLGRLERIPNAKNFPIFVDYAHTPDALENVLTTLRDADFARIITVFGCGGNRDTAKRPLMAQVVAKYADIAIVTSDNPRHEDPLAIIEDMRPGLSEAREVIIEPNRRLAIEKAIALMTPQDVLLIAGKGHEQTQEIGDIKHPFSDQTIVREMLG